MQSGKSLVDVSADSQQGLVADIKSVLGDAGFAQYTDYTKNDMANQTLWTTMKNDFADNPLSDAQQQQLLQAMKGSTGTSFNRPPRSFRRGNCKPLARRNPT